MPIRLPLVCPLTTCLVLMKLQYSKLYHMLNPVAVCVWVNCTRLTTTCRGWLAWIPELNHFFKLFPEWQTERVCRWQFEILWKWQKVLQTGKKHWEKEKLLVTSNFSFSHRLFQRLGLQTHTNFGLFGKGWRRLIIIILLSLLIIVLTLDVESN